MPLVILLFALFASLFTFSKAALGTAEPFFLVGSRMLIAGVLLVGFQMIFKGVRWSHIKAAVISLTVLGVLNIYLANTAEIWGLKHMSSAKTCLLYSFSPFLSALLAFFALGERLNKRKWLALVVGFVGLIPIMLVDTQDESLLSQFAFVSLAELAVVVAVLASVYGWILLKKAVTKHGLSPLTANGFSMIIGGALTLAHSYAWGESYNPLPILPQMQVRFLEFLVVMLLISNIICYNLYGYLLKRFSATFMSLAGLVTPIFASVFGWLFLGETITWHYFASIAIFSTGLFIFYKEEISAS